MCVLKYVLWAMGAVVGAAVVFFAFAWATEYRPAAVEVLYRNDSAPSYPLDSLSFTSWNIGYAGMDSGADFFMDGGKTVRRSRAQVEANLQQIAATLEQSSSSFVLLQEVDVCAKRSYYTPQFEVLKRRLAACYGFLALNFNSNSVPIPLTEPVGKVEAGLVIFSRWQPKCVERWAYPSQKAVPVRWFHLKRCFVAARFAVSNQRELVVVNTHNSAFDAHDFRAREMDFLRRFLLEEYAKGNYVVAGGDWNQTPPGYPPSVGTPAYTPIPVPADFLPPSWNYAYDPQRESFRFANIPYREGKTLTSTVDFFVFSPNLSLQSVAVQSLRFAHSDHDPVHCSLWAPSSTQ